MQLDPAVEKRIRARAAAQGDDPDDAVAEAERIVAEDTAGGGGEIPRPPIERLGAFLPFIKVRELRAHWLGLDESMTDDDLSCREYLAKHGGAPTAPATSPPAKPAPGAAE